MAKTERRSDTVPLKKFMLGVLCLAVFLVATSLWAADAPVTTAPSGSEPGASLTEINKKLTNPVSDLWSIAFQQNNYILDMGPGKIFLAWWLEYRIFRKHPGELEGRQSGRRLDHPTRPERLQSCEVRQTSG